MIDRRVVADSRHAGEARYWSAEGAGPAADAVTYADVAWSYEAPLREAVALTGLVATRPTRSSGVGRC